MSDYTEAQNYLELAVSSNDQWFKDRALRRASDEITRLQAENEALRARVAELERVIPGQIIKAHQRAEVCWDSFNHLDAALGSPMVRKFVLRKQAEAVEEIVDADPDGRSEDGGALVAMDTIWDYAQNLRTQADALERKSEGGAES